jgi:hypothetical protein
MRAIVTLVFLAGATCAHAQDLSISGGVMQSDNPDARSFALGFLYTHELGTHLAASVGYRNEGHVPGHHRDGQVALAWLKGSAFAPELSFAVGGGPYHYFDTTIAEGGGPQAFNDAHGWGWLYGASATWQPRASRWFYQLRMERTETGHNLDTVMVMAGVGYHLEQDGTFKANSSGQAWARVRDDEVFGALGQTIVNSFESQSAGAGTLEYRHAFGPVIRASVGWIHENDTRLVRREGIAVQGWLEPSFSGDRFTLGVGLGAYISVDEYRPGTHDVLGLVTMTASHRFASHWVGRFSWHRVSTGHDRDSDIILLGAGYQF